MPLLWSFSQLIEYNFRQVASVLFQKYPNDYATHVVSVDVIDRSVDPETGVVRSERLIGVKQPAPKWVTALLGTSAESYAREVMFVVPATRRAEEETDIETPPQVLVSSINMSLKNILTCYERISYTATSEAEDPSQRRTKMKTIAAIEAQGTLRTGGFAAKRIGGKMEEWSMDRYIDNSHIGRQGLDSVLEERYPQGKNA